jgi:BMFP domain-containing protein YqiC
MEQKLLDEINERVKAVLAQGPAADLEKNLKAMLGGLFGRLDLVTREEFDVQREVLLRTRAKLAELERKVAELEQASPRSADSGG